MRRRLTYDPFGSIILVFAIVSFCFVIVYVALPNQLLTGIQNSATANKDLFTIFLTLIAAVTSLWNAAIAKQYAAQLEEFKQQLNSKFPALKETREAALSYYRALAKMEIQAFSEDELKASEEIMIRAEGSVYFLDEDYQKAWYDFWQTARNAAVRAGKISKADAQTLWREELAKKVANDLRKIAIHHA